MELHGEGKLQSDTTNLFDLQCILRLFPAQVNSACQFEFICPLNRFVLSFLKLN
jgi:hypothetical protein